MPVTSTALEGMKGECNLDIDVRIPLTGHFKKSLSLGGGLCEAGIIHGQNAAEDESDHGFSSQNILVALGGRNHLPSHHQYSQDSESVQVSSDIVNEEFIFSIGDPHHSDKEAHENSDSPLCAESANDSGDHTPPTGRLIVKSCSMPNILSSGPTFTGCSPKYLVPSSRSSADLHVLEMHWKEVHGFKEVLREEERDCIMHRIETHNFDNYDAYHSYSYSALTKDWVLLITDEVKSVKNLQEQLSTKCWDQSISSEFKFKQIKEWVNDIRHYSPVKETDDSFHSNDDVNREPSVMNGLTVTRADTKITAMEAAKRYISCLSSSATTAQLTNHGLLVISFLSAFVSLRMLNLSGNGIVSVTAGALPRGLHLLSLLMNNISTIEGLRELTWLCVLDLSYKRILRIGHGLASCSSLKELCLARNKISEVDSLHRLLKLDSARPAFQQNLYKQMSWPTCGKL